jgi:hypothetical protein
MRNPGPTKEPAMGNYLLLYTGDQGAPPASEEEGKAVMDAWIAWFTTLGEAVVDAGNPLGSSVTVAGDGSTADGGASGVGGYSVLRADSLGDAAALTAGCPHLEHGRVEVYETFDVM